MLFRSVSQSRYPRYRRIDFPLWVELKPEFKDSRGRFKVTEGLVENAHDFYLWDPKSGNKDSKKLSTDDVVKMIAAKYQSIKQKAEEELVGTSDFIAKYKDIFPEQQAPTINESSDEDDETPETIPKQLIGARPKIGSMKWIFSEDPITDEELSEIVDRTPLS